jgi:hypothetical protein
MRVDPLQLMREVGLKPGHQMVAAAEAIAAAASG